MAEQNGRNKRNSRSTSGNGRNMTDKRPAPPLRQDGAGSLPPAEKTPVPAHTARARKHMTALRRGVALSEAPHGKIRRKSSLLKSKFNSDASCG